MDGCNFANMRWLNILGLFLLCFAADLLYRSRADLRVSNFVHWTMSKIPASTSTPPSAASGVPAHTHTSSSPSSSLSMSLPASSSLLSSSSSTTRPAVTVPSTISSLSPPANDLAVQRLEDLLNLDARQEVFHSTYTREHFITYFWDPSWAGGFNNRLQALELTLLLAVLLNRTLAIQPFSDAHERGQDVSYTKYLETISAWPVVERVHQELGKIQPLPLDQKKQCRLDVFELLATISPAMDNVRTVKYDCGWAWWPEIFASKYHTTIRRFLSRHVRFHRSLCNGPLIDGPYAALHARLGDRAGISLVNCSHFGFDFTAPKSWESKGMSAAERESIMFGCVKGRNLRHVDVITIEEAMKAWTLPSHIQTVYIATNRPSSSRISTIKEFLKARSLKPLLWEDLSMSLASARDGTAIRIVEQCFLFERLWIFLLTHL